MTTVLLPWPLTTTQSTPWLRVDVGTSTRRTRSVSLNRCGSNTTIRLWAEGTCMTGMPENMRFKCVARNGTGHTELDTSSSKGHSREGVRGTCAAASQPSTAANATSLFAQLASTHITLANITAIQVSFKASVLYIGQSIFQQM